MKKFLVVIPKDDGGVELYPMKEWLRQHADSIPSGMDATQSTSHQLRLGLKKIGWQDHDTGTEIRMSPPGSRAPVDVIDEAGDADDEALSNEDAEVSFSLEYQLRDFIAQNIDAISICGRRLRLYVDPTGKDGIEYRTAVGPIDILAQDVQSGAFVVFELKRGRTPDHVIGQIARYIGWLKSTIAKDVEVRGVIVAKQITENLRYAIVAVPGISLFEYEVSFSLRAVGPA